MRAQRHSSTAVPGHLRLQRVERVEFGADSDADRAGTFVGFRKEVHATTISTVLWPCASAVTSISDAPQAQHLLRVRAGLPVVISVVYGQDFINEARLAGGTLEIERRAEEALSQDELAPRAWAERLAPDDRPSSPDSSSAGSIRPGTGLMAGDFFDVFRVGPNRIAAVIGDVAGHGIESSITAFQAKYLLRVFLRQFRDPAQALEELNTQMAGGDRIEEFISLLSSCSTPRPAPCATRPPVTPPALLWHDREVRPLQATGPLLMLDPKAAYYSREIPMDRATSCCLYTDGLAEAVTGISSSARSGSSTRREPGRTSLPTCSASRCSKPPATSPAGHRRRRRHPGDPAGLTPVSRGSRLDGRGA